MHDTELYRHLLDLVAPWEVSRVELSDKGGRVDVWVEPSQAAPASALPGVRHRAPRL